MQAMMPWLSLENRGRKRLRLVDMSHVDQTRGASLSSSCPEFFVRGILALPLLRIKDEPAQSKRGPETCGASRIRARQTLRGQMFPAQLA